MTTLFIDTTYDVTLGLLGDDRKWIDVRTFKGQKSSAILQPEVLNLLKAHGQSPKNISQIINIAGPGFYTGLRLSEGFCDVFNFFNIPHYSFYSYEIPAWCGHDRGTWITKAYRGEYFLHSWESGKIKSQMIATKDLADHLKDVENVYIHSLPALDALALDLIKTSISTSELLQNEPQKIFDQVLNQKLKRESFYFRAPEDEFKANP